MGLPKTLYLVLGVLLMANVIGNSQADVPLVTVRPADNGQALVNPAMGWTMHFYSNLRCWVRFFPIFWRPPMDLERKRRAAKQ